MMKFVGGLILLAVIVFGLTYLTHDPEKRQAGMPWDITIMPDGNPSVFSLHLGTTSYRDAQLTLKEFGKSAVFTEQGKASSVEAYFSSIHLGGLDAKLVLNLAVPEQNIETMLSRAAEARIQPSGARRYELSNQDNADLIDAKVIAITYIPFVRLSQDMVTFRFGEASSIELDETSGAEFWFYPDLGLSVQFKTGEKTILQYQTISDT